MRMSIEKMVIDNFKGCRHLEINFGAAETHICGMNGSGKTTLPDAFSWVLFNKDSHGNAPGSDSFREKPLDDEGHEIHNLDTTVELQCMLDGKAFCLKRTQQENWVKKRGSVNPVYQGNVSTYWINGVETKLSDFRARIAEIAPEDIFRLIGTLAAFNAQEMKARREQLLALSGSDVDEKLLQTAEYRQLADECAQRNIGMDDLRKVLADQRKRTNTELQMIPVRIDEARKALPQFAQNEVSDAEYIIETNTANIERINGYIAEEKAKSAQADNKAQIMALEREATSLTRQVADAWAAGQLALDKRRTEAAEDFKRIAAQIAAAKARQELLTGQLTRAEEQRDTLRSGYSQVKSEQFQWTDGSRVCPTCGQTLPEEKIRETKEIEQRRFEVDKKARLTDIAQRGQDRAKEIEQLTGSIAAVAEEISGLEQALKEAQERRDAVSEEIKAYPAGPDYASNPRIEELRNEIAALKEARQESPEEKIYGLEQRKAELQKQIDEKRAIIARRDAGEETERRIKVLEREQRAKGNEVAELEQMIALADKFVLDRCAALEEGINSHFPTVRWKLFEQQINGGIKDVCMCMVPCQSGLVAYESANTAAQVNADIEIINVLSRHYGVSIPLFVDGAESVNHLAHTDSQLITLSVSTDAQLTTKEVA